MLKIYISKKDVPKRNNRFIESVDMFFNSIMYNLSITDKDMYYMSSIDKADYVGNGRIKTVFGDTTIENLSTGCKALILLNHYKDRVISINECGENALDYVYKDNAEGNIYLSFAIYPNEYNPKKKVVLCRNGREKEVTLAEVFDKFNK